jgi:type IV fimbrial biogenesis protein FimT
MNGRIQLLRRASAGFTLVELLITVAIIAILAAIAVPVINSNTPASEANSLLGALQFARTSAVKLGQNIVVCPSTDGATCTGSTSWSVGWIVLAPQNGLCSSTGASKDVVLQVQSAFTNQDTATFTPLNGNSISAFCYSQIGFSLVSNTGWVQFDSNPANLARRRCLSVVGVGHMQVFKHGQTDTPGVVSCP